MCHDCLDNSFVHEFHFISRHTSLSKGSYYFLRKTSHIICLARAYHQVKYIRLLRAVPRTIAFTVALHASTSPVWLSPRTAAHIWHSVRKRGWSPVCETVNPRRNCEVSESEVMRAGNAVVTGGLQSSRVPFRWDTADSCFTGTALASLRGRRELFCLQTCLICHLGLPVAHLFLPTPPPFFILFHFFCAGVSCSCYVTVKTWHFGKDKSAAVIGNVQKALVGLLF